MENLPIEISEEILGKILWENPAELYRLRVVCSTWREIIDECWSRLFQLWQCKCSKIPEQSFNDIAQVLFPLSSKAWQKMYWKDRMLPHVPRAVYQAWKNLPNLMGDHLKITTCPIFIRNSAVFPSFAINDKYLAVSYRVSEKIFTTSIYELSNLKNSIRDYPVNCKNIDFYTVGTRMFIVVVAAKSRHFCHTLRRMQTMWTVYISEFKQNDKLKETDLYSNDYAIVDNECFTFKEFDLTHHVFINEKFTPSTKISLPTDDLGQDSIKKVRIEGSEVFVCHYYGRTMRIFKYKIARGPDDKLNFTPVASNFIEKVAESFRGGLMSKKKRMDLRFYLKRREFSHWFYKHYHHTFTSLIVHGDYIITGTDAGKLFIFHRGVEEIMKCISQSEISLDYTVIDLKIRGFDGPAAPAGLTYIDSTPRLIVDNNRSVMAIDFL